MKRHYLSLPLLVFTLISLSFGDKSIKSDINAFTVDGLQVIVKPAVNEVISTQLFIKGGTSNYSAEQQGIETLALMVASEGGTKNRSKETFKAQLEKYSNIFFENLARYM